MGGATTSDAEPGSAQWWLDVAAVAAAGVTVGQLVRGTRLLGKGSYVDNWRVQAGRWIEGLPLIGRGPEDLRELKRQRCHSTDATALQTAPERATCERLNAQALGESRISLPPGGTWQGWRNVAPNGFCKRCDTNDCGAYG